MTRSGYRTMLVVLVLAGLSGVFFSLWLSWTRANPTEMTCDDWERSPAAGRYRLTGCLVTPKPRSLEYDAGIVLVGASQSAWTTTGYGPTADRAYQRYLVVSGDMRRSIDVRIDSPYPGTFVMRDLGSTTVSIWLGLIPIFVFGIPLMWLVRRQRTWRAARLAWERAQGVVTEGDKPTAF